MTSLLPGIYFSSHQYAAVIPAYAETPDRGIHPADITEFDRATSGAPITVLKR
jgi:hypothetical protein